MTVYPAEILIYEKGAVRQEAGALPVEEEVLLTVNGQDLVGLMCTPTLLDELAVGFLYNEGLIDGMEDVASVRVCGSRHCVDVWLYRDVEIPTLRTLTSGCGGGTTFEDLREARPPLTGDLTVTPDQVVRLMRRLQDAAVLYRQVRGLHTSALAEGQTGGPLPASEPPAGGPDSPHHRTGQFGDAGEGGPDAHAGGDLPLVPHLPLGGTGPPLGDCPHRLCAGRPLPRLRRRPPDH